MCACKFNYGRKPVLDKLGIPNTISSSEFSSGATNALFQLFFCINKDKVNQKLSEIKVKGETEPLRVDTKKDMELLANIHDNNNDVKVFGVDIKEKLLSIDFTQDELNNASCQVGFSTGN